MLIKTAVGYPQLGNHRQEAVSEPARVHPGGGRDGGCRGGAASSAAEALLRGGAARAARAQARERQEEPAQPTDEKPNTWEQITTYNNFYEFGTDKDVAGDVRAAASRPSRGRSPSRASAPRPATCNLEDILKWLPLEERIYRHALRRGVVDGDSVGRLPAGRLHQAVRADRRRRSSSSSPRSTIRSRCPASAQPVLRLAVRRRPAHGRGDAPADDPRRRPVRRGAAEPERRAAAAGGAVEVRLQEHQVDRQDPLRREAAAEHVAGIGAAASTASTRT